MSAQLVTVDLARLANDINACVKDAETHARSAVEHALRAGAMLNTAKSNVAHGEWQTWLEANCEVAPRTAQAYMRLVKSVAALPASEAQRVAGLPLREAVRAIATSPDAPPKSTSYRVESRDRRERFMHSLKGSAASLRSVARDLDGPAEIKATKIEALRKKLQATIDTLDEIVGGVAT